MEKKERQKPNRSVLRYLNETAGRTRWNIVAMMALRFVQASCTVLYAFRLRDIINCATAGDRSGFWRAVLGFALLVLLRLGLSVISRYLREKTSATLENRMKSRLFSMLLDRDYGCVSAVHSGEWMNRLVSDTKEVADDMASILPDVTGMLVRLIGTVAAIIILAPELLYVIIPMGVLAVAASYAVRKLLKRLYKDIREKDGKLRTFLQESLESELVIRSFGVEKEIRQEAEGEMEDHKHARMKRNWVSNFFTSGYSAVMDLIYIAGAIFCGYGILTGTMDYGTFTAILELVGQMQGPLSNLSGILPQYYAMEACAERLMEAEELPEEDEETPLTLSEIRDIYQQGFSYIEFRHATYTYPPVAGEEREDTGSKDRMHRQPAVEDISLKIPRGTCTALVGPSGCGKSTLLKLLMSLYPLDAGVRIININGKDEPLTGKYRRLFAYVPQDFLLMSGTVREIVAFPDPDRMQEDDQIWQALSLACADAFVRELPQGIDTMLGERGAGLSEGQMQRLAIARAVFSDHPVLLLDECTSALDGGTERQLLDHLRKMTEKTVIIVTHRQEALSICDEIFQFLPDGEMKSEREGEQVHEI